MRFLESSLSHQHPLFKLMSGKLGSLTSANPESFLSDEHLDFRLLFGIDRNIAELCIFCGFDQLRVCESSPHLLKSISKSVPSRALGKIRV
jgi:hypothetical protein